MRYLSLCSGIEAATVAWHPLGWEPIAFAETEKFPSSVLVHHYPSVPNLGDITKFREWPDASFDVLVGGTPCQSFSVAGLRKGLADPRGNLMLVYLGILDRYRPRWMVWENVPGVLSSNKGRDFGAFLGGLAELGYGFAYRVLDAQYAGLAQRRKRVFVVGHFRDWRRAAAVLFERESLRWNSPPRRKEGQEPAPTLSARTQGGGGLGTDFECDGGLVANPTNSVDGVSHALRAKAAGMGQLDPFGETFVAFGGNNQSGPIDVATAQTAHGGSGRYDFETETFVVFDETQITSAENRCNPQPGDPSHPLAKGARPPTIAFSAKDHDADAMSDLSPTLRAGGHNESHANAGVMPAIAFHARQDQDSGPVTHPLGTHGSSIEVLHQWRVRRLTPRECERLQGFPDDYTLIPGQAKIPAKKITADWLKYIARCVVPRLSHADVSRLASDGPRYKALGNSMAVPVMRRIGEGIAALEQRRAIP